MRLSSLCCVAIACVLLQACTEPVFEYRGYTDLSDCRHVIDAEMARGAIFEDAYDSLERSEPELVTELHGQIYDENVIIEVACNSSGDVNRIFYVVSSMEPEQTGDAFIRFANALELEFGVPEITVVEGSRTLEYLCPGNAPVVLEEYVVSEEEHELYLGVVPSLAICAVR